MRASAILQVRQGEPLAVLNVKRTWPVFAG